MALNGLRNRPTFIIRVLPLTSSSLRAKIKALYYSRDWAQRILLWPLVPQTTYQDALFSVPLLHKGKYRSALIVTNPYHLYRVRWTFHQVLNNSSVHLLFVSTDLAWNKDWWKDKKSRFYVISEVSKIGYYWILQGLLRIEEDPPWAIELKTRYEKWLGGILL